MPTPFETDFSLVLPDHFARFGETLVFLPAGGTERELTGIVAVTAQTREADELGAAVAEIQVTVLTDEDDDQYGGIAAPVIGDAIRRGADDADRWYGYTGEALESDAVQHTLRFTRSIPYQHGRGQMRS